MDPRANLSRQLELAREILALIDAGEDDGQPEERVPREVAARGEALAELVLALDGWRRAGGFDPYQREEGR